MKRFFRRLLRRQKLDNAVTAPLSEQQIQAILSNQGQETGLPQLISACGQSIGKQRDTNEDSLFAFTATIGGPKLSVPFGLYMVADGMGGHQDGEMASNAAIRVFSGSVLRKFNSYLFGLPSQMVDESLQEIMQAAMSEAHYVIQRQVPGSGTTLTAVLVLGQQMTIAHVGDSRAYLLYPDGRLDLLTRDHSLVKRLEELGQLTAAEAATSPHRNVLIRALGQGDSVEADVFTLPLPSGGIILLCSDGLWGVVTEADMQRIVMETPVLVRACQNLVSAANTAGGPDNISVVLAQIVG
ncbi:MAG: PP2C family protein-serine/threonine phosphatase [Candidatus Villigracilaceae bacterium]